MATTLCNWEGESYMAIKLKMHGSSKITEKEIGEFLALLPPRYTNLDVTINVYGSRVKWWFTKGKKSRGAFGDYNYTNNTISIYTFVRQKGESYLKIRILEIILHEIRHAYQAVYHKDKFLYDHKNYISCEKDGEGYTQQWIEVDARKFSRRVLNLYRDEINRIIGHDINDHWRVYESS